MAYVGVLVLGMILIVGTPFLLHRGPSLHVDTHADPNLAAEEGVELATVGSRKQPALQR